MINSLSWINTSEQVCVLCVINYLSTAVTLARFKATRNTQYTLFLYPLSLTTIVMELVAATEPDSEVKEKETTREILGNQLIDKGVTLPDSKTNLSI